MAISIRLVVKTRRKVQVYQYESRSTVVYCAWTEFGRHDRYIVNKGTWDDGGYGCEFTIVLGVRGQEESALSQQPAQGSAGRDLCSLRLDRGSVVW